MREICLTRVLFFFFTIFSSLCVSAIFVIYYIFLFFQKYLEVRGGGTLFRRIFEILTHLQPPTPLFILRPPPTLVHRPRFLVGYAASFFFFFHHFQMRFHVFYLKRDNLNKSTSCQKIGIFHRVTRISL